MSYKITIEKTENVTRMVNGDYAHIRTEYISAIEWSHLDERERREWSGREDGKEYKKEIRNYAPKVEKTTEESVTIYTQVLETLDIAKLVNVINEKS